MLSLTTAHVHLQAQSPNQLQTRSDQCRWPASLTPADHAQTYESATLTCRVHYNDKALGVCQRNMQPSCLLAPLRTHTHTGHAHTHARTCPVVLIAQSVQGYSWPLRPGSSR